MNKRDLILKILERVPLPYVPETARAIEAVIAVVHQDQAAAGESLEEWRKAIADALAADISVWQRIQQRAAGDLQGPITTGSTGD